MGDKIVFKLNNRRFGLDTSVVHRVIEVDKIFFLPGQSGIVNGIVSLMGEPVTVVDCRKALEGGEGEGQRHKIIVVRDKGRLIGFDVGGANLSFDWEQTEESGAAPEPVDWAGLFEETKKILSRQIANG